MEFKTYFDNKFNLDDAHTRHLHDKVESSLTGVAYGTGVLFNLATARRELDKMSASVKVTKTGLGLFQTTENKSKPQAEVSSGIQPKSPSNKG